MAKTKTKPSSKIKASSKIKVSSSTGTKTKAKKTKAEVTTDRRRTGSSESKDRRTWKDRRTKDQPVAVEHRGMKRRAKVNRRRQIDPTTCERAYTPDELEFMHALDRYKRSSGRMFPTCSEVLEVLGNLGYVKTAPKEAPPHATDESPAEQAVD